MYLLIVATLAAAPPPAAAPMKLASPGLKCVNLDAAACEFFSDYFAQQLSTATGLKITTQSEISSVLGFERQKQLLGCSDNANSCLAEMAGALGVDGLVIGNLAKFGTEYVPNIKVISARDGNAIAAQTGRVSGDSAILDWMASAAQAMSGQLKLEPTAKMATPPPAPPPAAAVARSAPPFPAPALDPAPPGRPGNVLPWIAGGASLAALAGGAVFYGMASGKHQELLTIKESQEEVDLERVRNLSGDGTTFQTVSFSLLGLGVAGGIATGVLFSLKEPPAVTLVPTPGGAMFSFGGVLR